MELEAAARRWFLTQPTITGYVGAKVFKHRLEEHVDGTGGRAVVVARNGGWATPTENSQEWPLLAVKFYADPDRDAETNVITAMNAEDKAMAMYRASDRLLHGRRGFRMGAYGSDPGLMVVTARRWKEPATFTDKDRHGQSSGDPLGDAVYVYVEYALQVLH